MRITLKTYSVLRGVIGKPELVMEIDDGSTIEDLFSFLIERSGEEFERETGSDLKGSLGRNFNVYLGGRLVYPAEYPQTKLQDEDEVIIMRPIGGG